MNADDLLQLLSGLEGRIEALAALARETNDRSQQALTLINKLHRDVAQAKRKLLSTTETGQHKAIDRKEPR